MNGFAVASTVLMVLTSGATPEPPIELRLQPLLPRRMRPQQSARSRSLPEIANDDILPAQLTPYEQVDIYPKVTGFVETWPVDRGSRVHRGQVLVQLTAPELMSQRSQADAAVRAAQSQLATAQAKLASDNGTYLHMVEAAKTPGCTRRE